MGKKKFGDITFGRKLDIENINANEKTKEVIIKAMEEPTSENILVANDEVNRDDSLTIKEKKIILNELNNKIISTLNFKNCPEDYESLKTEAKFLAGMTQYSFLLMAQRLQKIRDNKLYRKDGYDDFKSFIIEELKVAQRTAYDYINLIEVFGLRALAIKKELKYSKLIPAIPLINKIDNESDKEKVKSKIINDAEIKSYREMVKEVNTLKQKYGMYIQEEKKINLANEIVKFMEMMIKNETLIGFQEQEKLGELIPILEKLKKKNLF